TRATMSTCRELSVWATKLTMYGMTCGVTVMTVTTGAGRCASGASLEQAAANNAKKPKTATRVDTDPLRFRIRDARPRYLRCGLPPARAACNWPLVQWPVQSQRSEERRVGKECRFVSQEVLC